MKKMFSATQLATVILLSLALTACGNEPQGKKIGIVVPIEHQAMNDIVDGFKETLQKEYHSPVNIKVSNAEGDMNTQRAIIQQMRDQHYDIIAPIGLVATQMTVSAVRNTPIVSIASSYSAAERKKLHPCNLVNVDDEIAPEAAISFIHQVYPSIKNITLIHSATEKVFPDVKSAIAAGNKFGITIKPLMVSQLSELYSVANSLPANTQAIFILKDNLIVSGINTLAQLAEKNKIPLITSDQGSVQENAAFALGVHEKEIGERGGMLAAEILSGKNACDLPMVVLKNLTVFVNQAALEKENQSLTTVEKAAKAQHYKLELVTKK